jgi:uncharacterized membrane protein
LESNGDEEQHICQKVSGIGTSTETFRSVDRRHYYLAWVVIVLVGFVLILIAAILQIKAFFSLPESPTSQPTIQVQAV